MDPGGPGNSSNGGSDPKDWRESVNSTLASFRQATLKVRRWVEDHREEIEQFTSGLMILALLQPRLKELERQFGDSEWAYLLERMDFINGLALMVLLTEEEGQPSEGPVLDFLEGAIADPKFLAEVRSQLQTAPVNDHQRRQLAAGLSYVEKREYDLAVPLMIIPLEGAFAGEAERRQLVERAKTKLRFTEVSGKKGNVRSVEDIFKPLGLDQDLDSFLRRQVYGGKGNAFRHGTALEGWRQKALSLTIALVACMDLMAETEETLLIKAFSRYDQGVEIVTGLVRQYQDPNSQNPVLSPGAYKKTDG